MVPGLTHHGGHHKKPMTPVEVVHKNDPTKPVKSQDTVSSTTLNPTPDTSSVLSVSFAENAKNAYETQSILQEVYQPTAEAVVQDKQNATPAALINTRAEETQSKPNYLLWAAAAAAVYFILIRG
jgi:hypothetical protein